MPAGFQAWDEQGRLIADLGDYTVKFRSRHTFRYPGGVQVVSVSIPGLVANNSFCNIIAPVFNNMINSEFYAKTKNGGFDLIYLPDPRGTTADNFTVDVYEFI